MLKRLFKYMGVFLLSCLGIVFIVLGCMVVFKFELFGYKYISFGTADFQSMRITSGQNSARNIHCTDPDLIDKITVNSNAIGVEIQPWVEGYDSSNSSSQSVTLYKIELVVQAKGFAKVDENGETVVYDFKVVPYKNALNQDRYELVLNVTTPSGLIKYTNAKIIVNTPFKDSEASKTQTTTTSAEYQISNYKRQFFDTVNITTTSGDVKISDNSYGDNWSSCPGVSIYVNNLNVKTDTGNQTFDRCGLCNIDLDTKRGDIEFRNLNHGAITGNVKISNDRGDIFFDSGINIGVATPKGQNLDDSNSLYSDNTFKQSKQVRCQIFGALSQIRLNTLYNTILSYEGNADNIKILSLVQTSADIKTNNSFIEIGSIYSDSAINLYASDGSDNKKGSRKIKIDYIECSDNLKIDTWNGPIKIGTLKMNSSINPYNASLTSDSGNITVNNAYGNVSAYSKYGNITIGQRIISNEASDIETLKNEISQRVYMNDFKSKIALKEYLVNLREKTKTSLTKYYQVLNDEIDKVDTEIQKINNKIIAEKESIDISAIQNSIRTSNIYAENKTGNITLNNIYCVVETKIVDNGKSPIYVDMKEINADVTINSGSGNVYLSLPTSDTNTVSGNPFWIYNKKGSVMVNNPTLLAGNETLEQGKCKASFVQTGEPYTSETYTIVSSGETSETTKTIEQLRLLNPNMKIFTICSTGGTIELK